MKIEIVKLPSGFYGVFVNGSWIDASSATLKQAREKANKIIQTENKRQIKVNRFYNIEFMEA